MRRIDWNKPIPLFLAESTLTPPVQGWLVLVIDGVIPTHGTREAGLNDLIRQAARASLPEPFNTWLEDTHLPGKTKRTAGDDRGVPLDFPAIAR